MVRRVAQMSKVAQGAFALVPSASNLEGLTKRLLVLRAEIDAILVELVSQAMATPQGAAKTAMPATVAALAPQIGGTLPAAAGRMTVSTLFAPLADGESTIEHHDAQEDNVGEDNPGQDAEAAPEPIAREPDIGENLEVSETVCAAVPELPVPEPALTLPEDEPAPLDDTQSVFAEAMPMVETCIDTAAPTGEADPLAEAQVAPPADTPEALPATGVVDADQPDDAVTARSNRCRAAADYRGARVGSRPQEPAAHSDAAPPRRPICGPATAQSRLQPSMVEAPRRGEGHQPPGAAEEAQGRLGSRRPDGDAVGADPNRPATCGQDRRMHPRAADGCDRNGLGIRPERLRHGAVAPLMMLDAVRSHGRRAAAAAS